MRIRAEALPPPPSAEATGAVPPQITSGEGAAAPSFFMRGQYHFLIYVSLAFRRAGVYSPAERVYIHLLK